MLECDDKGVSLLLLCRDPNTDFSQQYQIYPGEICLKNRYSEVVFPVLIASYVWAGVRSICFLKGFLDDSDGHTCKLLKR